MFDGQWIKATELASNFFRAKERFLRCGVHLGHPTPYWYKRILRLGFVGLGDGGQIQVSVFEMSSYEELN